MVSKETNTPYNLLHFACLCKNPWQAIFFNNEARKNLTASQTPVIKMKITYKMNHLTHRIGPHSPEHRWRWKALMKGWCRLNTATPELLHKWKKHPSDRHCCRRTCLWRTQCQYLGTLTKEKGDKSLQTQKTNTTPYYPHNDTRDLECWQQTIYWT